jgi:putative membrane protein
MERLTQFGVPLILAAALGMPELPAHAHSMAPVVAPDALWKAWHPDLLVAALLIVAGLLYGGIAFRLTRSYRLRRPPFRKIHLLAFAAGEIAIAIALLSPLEALSGTLVSAHMVQHVLLIAVAPPLIVAGRPDIAVLAGLGVSRSFTRSTGFRVLAKAWRVGERPLVATALQGVVIWMWHAPPLFHLALDYPAVHHLEHLMFFITAILFWRALFRATRSSQAAAAGLLAAQVTLIHGGFLGALITFAPRPLYSSYVGTELWGISALEDQQLAGMIMWIPTGMIYLLAGLALAARMLTPPAAATRGRTSPFEHQ